MEEKQTTPLLLVCNNFPPHHGIGGRRWAKFAKYLTRSGFEVHVICCKNNNKDRSLWNADVGNNSRIFLYQLPTNYPAVLQSPPTGFFRKLNYFLWLQLFSVFTKGNFFDKTIFWKKKFLSKANELIATHQIRNVIVSGAPFNLTYFATFLKDKHRNINLITDFRDPWTWGPGYGYGTLSRRKIEFEKKKEAIVVNKSDTILIPVEVMKSHLQNKYPSDTSKFFILPHAFDEDEMSSQKKSVSRKLRLIFYGSIYDYIEYYIISLCEVMKLNEGKVTIDFYSDSMKYTEVFTSFNLNESVHYLPELPAKELFSKFKDYDYALLIHPDYGINHLSTKFHEIIETGTPLLYLANYGSTAEFVIKNKIGIHLPPGEFKKGFQKLIDNKEMPDYNYNYDNSAFSFSQVTKNLVTHFK